MTEGMTATDDGRTDDEHTDPLAHVGDDWVCCPDCLRWTPPAEGTATECKHCGTDVTEVEE